MKKIYFVIAALAAVTLASCEKEKDFKDATPIGKDDIAFSMQSAATRSMDTMAPKAGMTIKLDNDFCLEETIEDMDYAAPATRGVPAYTFNVGNIYPKITVYGEYENADGEYVEGGFGATDFEKMDEEMVGGGWRYWHNYVNTNPWPDNTTPVDFYFSMPAQATGVTNLDYADQQITFTFDSPTNGAAQQDLLFSHTAVSKEEHDTYLPNGAPVMMYHALTGVKFRNGHKNDGTTKTIIKSVKFKNLKSHGICTVNPGAEEGATSKYKVSWEGLDNAAEFSMEFENPTYAPADSAKNSDGTVSFGTKEGEVPTFNGTSWVTAAADHNLNKADGSLTFWFIPQMIDENVTLEITFLVKTPDSPNGTEIPHLIEFGKLVTENTEWKAGQLRTYTLMPFDVDVEIVDKMTDLTKDSLHVANTGNVDEYVRVMVIGNWYGWKTAKDRTDGKEPSIMVGYTTDGSTGDNTMVKPWFREDDYYGQFFDDTFKGGRPKGTNPWLRGTGSYFYYPDVIGVGKNLSGTQALFQHYELKSSDIPTIYVPVSNQTTRQPAVGVHLVMEVVVQAVPATKPDGTEFATCWEAWTYAIGKEIKAK